MFDKQRVKITGGAGDWALGTSFLAAASPTTLGFTATPIADTTRKSLEGLLEPGRTVLGGWHFAVTTGYAASDPAYLSFEVGAGLDGPRGLRYFGDLRIREPGRSYNGRLPRCGQTTLWTAIMTTISSGLDRQAKAVSCHQPHGDADFAILRHATEVAASLDGLWEWTLDTGDLRFSHRCAELVGYQEDGIPPTIAFFWEILHPDDVAATREAIDRCLQNDQPVDVEYRLRVKCGEYQWFRARAHTRRDSQGRPQTMSGVLQDITLRKQAEIALTGSESRFRGLCETSLAGIYIVHHGVVSYANPSLARLLACTPQELIGVSPLRFFHADDQSMVEQSMRARLQGEITEKRYEARFVGKDNRIRPVEVLATRIETAGGPALIGTILDISDRKQTEAAAADRLRFEELLANLSATFVNLSSDTLEKTIDSSLEMLVQFLGYDRSTFIEFTKDKNKVLVTHSYAAAGCERFPLGPWSDDLLPWYVGQLRQGKVVFMRDVPEDLPAEAVQERRYCEFHGIKSNVTIPLRAGGSLLGALTFAFLQRRCEWPDDIVTRLQLIGEVYANALLHKRADDALRSALAENKSLRRRLEQENRYLREQSVLKHQHGRIIGQSDSLLAVLAKAERVAVTDTPVLLLGETGTGKELLAHTIHELSRRKDRPMVIVNCASLPGTLIESELFGRAAGAYTGAASAQIGRFVVADGSTLFLDEVGEFPVELQAKLLRVLQDGRFERLGSPETIKVDVRIIAATNRDLERAVREKSFRADLYHRLNVFPISIPPLRERSDDIPPLVWAFVESIGSRMGKTIKSIPRRDMERLQQYAWPGNIRELSNIIERAMILATDDTLRLELPSLPQHALAPGMTLKESERALIARALEQSQGRIRGAGGAAEILGLKPTTLEARMAKLGLKRDSRVSNIP